ncbi:hypothetical protein NT05LM_1469 [Listeria marthii FSL S4-120]|uniref:Uncharacterized protein n=1 Tax=Listeria marthii FSL S4-120 TaxID=702457 RepID=A0ABN0BXZ5_9LIST|nr:hypothetical protein NT05LM_1469 [Listeria marthii FSL S4-120]
MFPPYFGGLEFILKEDAANYKQLVPSFVKKYGMMIGGNED